jgi:hypothetical protein
VPHLHYQDRLEGVYALLLQLPGRPIIQPLPGVVIQQAVEVVVGLHVLQQAAVRGLPQRRTVQITQVVHELPQDLAFQEVLYLFADHVGHHLQHQQRRE